MTRVDLRTLDDYLTRYGHLLGSQQNRVLEPLHVPGRDPHDPGLEELLRAPFDAQGHLITAGKKCLRDNNALLLVAEMGTGKTFMGQGVLNILAGDKGYVAIVMCPGQLVKKWRREILETIPNANVEIIETYSDVIGLVRDRVAGRIRKPTVPTWYVIARDTAKLTYKKRNGFVMRFRRFETEDGHKYWGKAAACSKCGGYCLDKDGAPYLPDSRKLQKCMAPKLSRLGMPILDDLGNPVPCGAPLWQADREGIRKMEPAKLIHKKLKGFFDYFILDEAHEEKGAETAQANAAGSLAASCKKTIALTGTLIGGYAEHIRPLLFRLCPRSIVEEGFKWDDVMKFSERYGRIDTIITDKSGGSEFKNTQSRGATKSTRRVVRPGIMPSLFGRHLIGNAVFLSLDEVSAALPDLKEDVVPVVMDRELAENYKEDEETLTGFIRANAFRGGKRLLGPMLNYLLTYPDYPFDWQEVGFKDREGAWVGVLQPTSLSDFIRPKERALLDALEAERDLGRQCWVYCINNGEHDVQGRLAQLIEREGFKVGVLTSAVTLREREEWIERQGKKLDVVLSHPKLVETGLDLFSKRPMGHNFCTIMFYQTGYNLFTLRQASRRAWRIGQKKLCKVIYFYYQGTMQERAMELMGKKMVAAQALEGKFSSEGLVAMGGDDNMEVALAKSLAERLPVNAERQWRKIDGENAIAGNFMAERMKKLASQCYMPLFDDEEALLAALTKGGMS